MVCNHVASNSVRFAESGDTTSLFANKEGSSSERRMEGGIADETSMPPLKCDALARLLKDNHRRGYTRV